MTDYEKDHHDFEVTLQAFRPIGPPASMQTPAELGPQAGGRRHHGVRRMFVGGAALAATIGVGFVVWANRPAADPVSPSGSEPVSAFTADERQAFLLHWKNQPRVAVGLPSGGAAVVLIEFVDWLCPVHACTASAAQEVADRYAAASPGAVRYIVNDYPLNAECNPAVANTVRGHEASCAAAAAVRLTRARGRDREMVAWLARHRPDLAALESAQAVAAVQAEAARLLGAAPSEDEYAGHVEAVRRDAAAGATIGVTGVPTLYINGVRAAVAAGPRSVGYIELAIELERGRATHQ